ncbi:hypothetical protein M0802_008066 [Mischocyttarus mexicanus]|nr:hypothetical protein M0802_008066 [Mischocyttarus mexicanus]
MGSREDRDGIYPAADYLGNCICKSIVKNNDKAKDVLQRTNTFPLCLCLKALRGIPHVIPYDYTMVVPDQGCIVFAVNLVAAMNRRCSPFYPSAHPAPHRSSNQKSAVTDADDANAEADTSQKPTVPSRCLLGSALSSRPNSGV